MHSSHAARLRKQLIIDVFAVKKIVTLIQTLLTSQGQYRQTSSSPTPGTRRLAHFECPTISSRAAVKGSRTPQRFAGFLRAAHSRGSQNFPSLRTRRDNQTTMAGLQ